MEMDFLIYMKQSVNSFLREPLKRKLEGKKKELIDTFPFEQRSLKKSSSNRKKKRSPIQREKLTLNK